jgi:hypothetical protein
MDHRGKRLTIDFTGLCVFVTNEPEGTLKAILAQDPKCGAMGEAAMAGGKSKPMDHGQGRKTSRTQKAEMPMRHRPILSFDAKYLSDFDGLSKMQAIQLPNGDQILSWNLENRIVTMPRWKGAYPDRIVRCQSKADLPMFPRDLPSEMDVRWIPSLKVVTGAERILPVYTSDDPSQGGKNRNMALAARFDLDAGYLFSNAEVNRRGPMDLWEFKNGKEGPHTQYLGDTLRLELHSAALPKVVLEARAFGNSSDVEKLVLKPQEGRLEIAVTNFPEDVMPGKPLAHFPIYYELLDNPLRTPEPTMSGKAPAYRPRPSAGKGVEHAVAHNLQQVKCTPGMVP